jgi:hypothetical protein
VHQRVLAAAAKLGPKRVREANRHLAAVYLQQGRPSAAAGVRASARLLGATADLDAGLGLAHRALEITGAALGHTHPAVAEPLTYLSALRG